MVTWWNDKNIEVVNVDGKWVALYGWNGECWCDCWEVEEIKRNMAFGIVKDNITVYPKYIQIDVDDIEIVGYEFGI